MKNLRTFDQFINEGHSLSKKDLDNMIRDIRMELSAEGMGPDMKFDMAQSLVDGDEPMVQAIMKHYKIKRDFVVEWLADRI